MLPTISIIIPVYKVEEYIQKCIESVINQTYKGEIECLIINDCSPDNSIQIAESTIRRHNKDIHKNFKILNHEINLGLSAARNTGIRNSTGEYLYFLDSDDYITTDCIDAFVNTLNKYPLSELIIAGTVSNYFNIEKKRLPEYSENKRWIISKILSRTDYPITAWNKLIKREFIIKNELYFKTGIIHEDEYWNYFLCKYITHFSVCQKNTYYYVIREGSIMNSSNNDRSFKSWIFILNDFIKNIDVEYQNIQITHIFKVLHSLLVFKAQKDYSKKRLIIGLFKDISMRCSSLQRFIINIVICMPYFLNKKKIIYNNINRIFIKL